MYNNAILTLTKAESNKVVVARRSLYAEYVADIKNADTQDKMADILYMRDNTEVNALKMAYHLASISDDEGKAEECKNATDLIMKFTGLKKSMISNYRRVGKYLLTDENGDFFLHESLAGFSVTQLLEGLQGAVIASKFMEDCITGNINPSMSAKDIRQYYKDINAVEVEAVESETADTAEMAETADTAETEKKVNTKDSGVFPVYELIDSTGQVVGMVSINKDYDKESLNKYLKTLTLGKKVD